ncbi:hypothetical protein [Candidatus Rariloculus sp.]|uniref:hypothetical protein n=1 Tax=Candidatus Rariloculus sp. TaxID=3101265 RepID=UPI003D0F21DB
MDQWAQRYGRKNADNTRRLKPNTYRFVAQFWQDVVISSPPVITHPGARQQDAIDLMFPSLVAASRNVVRDIVRYGCGVFTNDTAYRPGSLDPRFYYPVARPERGEYMGAIAAVPFTEGATANVADRLAVTQYQQGSAKASKTVYALNGQTVGAVKESFDDAILAHPVLITWGEGEFGESWYSDIEEYVIDLHRRESLVSEALDRHTNPHLAVHEATFKVGTDGKVTVAQDGMILPIPDGADVAPQYVTWDAEFGAQETAMDRAVERIQRFTAIAPVLTQHRQDGHEFNVPSGSALRRLSLVTVQRINTVREALTVGMRTALAENMITAAGAGLEAPTLDADKIKIEWPLPLFAAEDDDEEPGDVND